MTQADTRLSTPPLNSPLSNTAEPSATDGVDTSRRRFLSQAAALTAGSAALATALSVPGSSARVGQAPDPIPDAIEAHKAAYAEWTKWLKRRGQLDEELPAEGCKTDLVQERGVVVETDDPRWIEAEQYGASWELLNIPLATTAAISALVDYALVHDVDGEQWPGGVASGAAGVCLRGACGSS